MLKCGIVERNILPERTLFATVKTSSGQEMRILGIHSITGCDYKKAKSLQYDCLAEFVSEYKPDIILSISYFMPIDADLKMNQILEEELEDSKCIKPFAHILLV